MRRTGFTLVEVLVVVGVSAILLSILSPVFSLSKEKARAVICSSNVFQLELGLMYYEASCEGFPYGFNDDPALGYPPGGYAGNKLMDKTGWWWFNYIGGVYEKWQGEKNVLWCPENQLRDPVFDRDVLCGNYGVNQSICKSASGRRSRSEFIGAPAGLGNLKGPSGTLLIADAGYSLVNWWYATQYPPVPLGNTCIEDTCYIPGLSINRTKDLWPGMEYDAIYGRHPNKNINIGFVDCHVELQSAETVLVERIGDGYKNRSPLWCPK